MCMCVYVRVGDMTISKIKKKIKTPNSSEGKISLILKVLLYQWDDMLTNLWENGLISHHCNRLPCLSAKFYV